MKQLVIALFRGVTALSVSCFLATGAAAEKAPEPFGKWLDEEVPVGGEIFRVKHADGYVEYELKIAKAVRENPEYFEEILKDRPAGVPFEWDEKLGLSKEEYDEYIKLWNSRKLESVAPGAIQMRKTGEGKYRIVVAGPVKLMPSGLAMLEFDTESGSVTSLQGELKRIEDINAPKNSILGAWTGAEWRLEKDDFLGRTKENFVLGQRGDNTYCYLVYRYQEIDDQGRALMDAALLMRFPTREKRKNP